MLENVNKLYKAMELLDEVMSDKKFMESWIENEGGIVKQCLLKAYYNIDTVANH